ALILTTVLLSSLLVIVSLARSGTNIFYDTSAKQEESNYKLSKSTLSSIVYLFSFTIILVLFANNITQITENIASNLIDTKKYISTVLNLNEEF
ncbi:MAG: monovalent cation/H+ antiporter subunit D, partial [Arcobacter skirrowii]|nr:monovalent cation/H+ antiporter subunit D [Aliarcobacter skirrowii]